MRRGSRLLWVAKWGGTGLSVVVTLLWLVSAVRFIEYRWTRGTNIYGISISSGSVGFLDDAQPDFFLSGEQAFQDNRQRPKQLREVAANPWSVERIEPGIPWMRWPALWAGGLSGTLTLVPFWMPFIVIVIPTAILWWRDRPPKPGHCPCGYDLHGNVSGVCPECGVEVQV